MIKPITVNSICDENKWLNQRTMFSISQRPDIKELSIDFDIRANAWSDDITGRIMAADDFLVSICLSVYLKRKITPVDKIRVTRDVIEKVPEDQPHPIKYERHYYFELEENKRIRLFGASSNCGEIFLDTDTFSKDQLAEIHNKIFQADKTNGP